MEHYNLKKKKNLARSTQLLGLWYLKFVWNFPWVHTLLTIHRLEILAKFPTVNSGISYFLKMSGWKNRHCFLQQFMTSIVHPNFFFLGTQQETNVQPMQQERASALLNLFRRYRYEKGKSKYRYMGVGGGEWFRIPNNTALHYPVTVNVWCTLAHTAVEKSWHIQPVKSQKSAGKKMEIKVLQSHSYFPAWHVSARSQQCCTAIS